MQGIGADIVDIYDRFKGSKALAQQQGLEQQKRSRMMEIGQIAGKGDYKGAASKALAYGDLPTGSSLLSLAQGQKKFDAEDRQQVAGALYAADTPEKWAATIDFLEKSGHEIDDNERDFNNRDAMIGQAIGPDGQLKAQKDDRAYALQERGFNADEAYRSQQIALEREKMNQPDKPPGLQTVGKGSAIYDPATQQWITPPAGAVGGGQAIDDPLKISKNFEGSPGMSRIAQIAPTIKSMEKSLTDPSAMADLDFVYGLAKILDPTSVVRESEAGMVIESQGIGPQMLGQLNKLMSGEQAMLPEIRKKLYGVAYRRAKELADQAQQERGHFSGVAKANQFDPETYLQQVPIMPEFADQTQAQPIPEPQGTTTTNVPWKIIK